MYDTVVSVNVLSALCTVLLLVALHVDTQISHHLLDEKITTNQIPVADV